MNKLGQLILVLLANDQPGEMMNAAAAVNKHLKKAGRDAHWLAEQISKVSMVETTMLPPANPNGSDIRRRRHEVTLWSDDLAFCAERLTRLSDREVEFVKSLYDQWTMHNSSWSPTIRQLRWLKAISDRLRQPDPFGRNF